MDLGQRAGNYPKPPQASKILGVEFSGVVEELGDAENTEFKVGDEVFGLAYGGKFYLIAILKLSGRDAHSP
jgi:NADPH:quinone reductase-like Zn-dependent oxidoreductase